ncbi:MAG: hypothetical protein OQK97_11530 [Deltaproteobacteria bacterium]|nr:hypothetical protein [Deltaproteobacteria bacterium]
MPAGFAFLRRSGFHFLCLLVVLVNLTGCAGKLNKAAAQFHAGNPQAALKTLERGDHSGTRNQLLFLLEKGVVLHQLGQYQQSAEQLLQAASLIDSFEAISLSEQAGSLVTNDWLTRYQGEYSERLWVHSYLMMNYLLLGQYDDALVEAKQALKRLQQYPQALKHDYFTRALIALCFANLAEDNDAYLVYRQLADDLPTPKPVAADIVYHAGKLGMQDEVERFKRIMVAGSADDAELVLFIAHGKIPEKQPGNVFLPPSIRFAFPYYAAAEIPGLKLTVSPVSRQALPLLSTDLGSVAQEALEARKLRIIAKETVRAAAKEAIAQSVGNKNDAAAEVIVRVALFLLEEPDTRCWKTLPGRLTLVRIPLAAGRHNLQLQLRSHGWADQQTIDLPEFELRRGQRAFRTLRF